MEATTWSRPLKSGLTRERSRGSTERIAQAGPWAVALAAVLGACAPDPGALPEACVIREPGAGEVVVERIVCSDQLVGGEGAVGDWLLHNAAAAFVVRGSYGALTQLGEAGGTLVDAVRPGEADLLMELLPEVERGEPEPAELEGAVELRFGGVVYRLEADAATLAILDPDGAPVAARWVPRPGATHTDRVARSGSTFFAVLADDVLADEVDEHGQVDVVGLRGVALTPAAAGPDGAPLEATVDAEAVVLRVDDRVVDRVPVVDGVVSSVAPAGATVAAEAAGCVYDGFTRLGCAGVDVWVRDDLGQPLAATVHFGDADHPLDRPGFGHAPLGLGAGEVWVWAGPAYGAWRGVYAGVDTEVRVTLPRTMPAEAQWPEGGGAVPAAGARLAAFGVQAAPDDDHGEAASRTIHALRAEGVGYANVFADDELPVVGVLPDDDVLLTSGPRVGGDVWSWGLPSNARRPAHGAPDHLGVDVLDRATLARGGAAPDRLVLVTPAWVDAALLAAPAWSWPTRPDALWLDGPGDLPTLTALADAWIDVQPVAARTWLPHEGVANLAVAHRALYERTASAGNGPRVDVELVQVPGLSALEVRVYAPGWMAPLTATLHTDADVAPLVLDAAGAAWVDVTGADWAYVEVSGGTARPWGGEAAWAVSALRWPGG